MRSRVGLWTLMLATAVVASLLLSELALRVLGRAPWPTRVAENGEPTMHEPHPSLGWRAKPGRYLVPPYVPWGSEIRMAFEEGGRRRSSDEPRPPGRELVIVGGSFAQGWAISDEETFGWSLQQRFPELRVLNHATGGYGTYQSLLVLESELPRLTSPELVIYGFIRHHEVRNVAPVHWLRSLAAHSRRGMIAVPYVSLGADGSLLRHPPQGYLALPLRRFSALVALLEESIMKLGSGDRGTAPRAVTERLIVAMEELSRAHGARLLVAILDPRPEELEHYRRFLERSAIPYADCATGTRASIVPGEGHPDGHMHAQWADCLSRALGEIDGSEGR